MAGRKHDFIVSLVLGLYIVAAVAFECTANTARISTIGIYLVFLTGLIHLLVTKQFQINEHCICLLLVLAYVYIMTIFNHNSLSNTVAYYCLTCTVLCLLSYNVYICADCERITVVCLLAFILGALILAVRVVSSYGGIEEMIKFASSGDKERRVGGELLNENTFGLYMANAFFGCLVLFGRLKSRRRWVSILLLLISPIFTIMLLLSVSKKAILFLIFGSIILIVYLFRSYKGAYRIHALIAIFVGVAVILYMIMNVPAFHSVSLRFSDMFSHLADSSSGSSSDQNRDYMISRGLSAFLESPVFGNGTAYSYKLFGAYAHNNFVDILMNYGLIGFLLYYFPYIILFPRLVSLTRNGNLFALYFLIFVSMQVFLGIAWVNYYERITQLFTIFAVGYSEMALEKEISILHKCKYLRES